MTTRQLPPLTDEEICICLAGGVSVVTLGYQARTGCTFDEAHAQILHDLEEVMSGRRLPQEGGARNDAPQTAGVERPEEVRDA